MLYGIATSPLSYAPGVSSGFNINNHDWIDLVGWFVGQPVV
jgi:hypothetical protein